MDTKTFCELSGKILDSCITVHKTVGPGLLETIYEQCLMREFQIRKIDYTQLYRTT